MEAHEVTPANIHLAVAALLTNQTALGRQLNSQDLVLLEIRTQTIRTNGRVLAAESAIAECKAGVRDALAKACPGTCLPLAEKVRALEDAQLTQAATVKGASFAIKTAWAVSAGLVAAASWLIGKGVVKTP